MFVPRDGGIIVISTSGIDATPRAALKKLVEKLGGRMDGAFTGEVTHLVTESVTTDKYRMAVEMRVPVVQPLWVEDSARLCSWQPEEPYLLRPLHRLVITVSGPTFNAAVRRDVERLVRRAGGEYSRALETRITHLVVDVTARAAAVGFISN